VKTVDAMGEEVKHTYDARGNLLSVEYFWVGWKQLHVFRSFWLSIFYNFY